MRKRSAPRKGKDDRRPPSPLVCTYCHLVLKDQCQHGVHLRVAHSEEIKLENSRRALSLSGRYYSPHSAVAALLAMPIVRPARARISDQTLSVKGSSSSDLSQPPTSAGSGPINPSSLPEGHQEPAHQPPTGHHPVIGVYHGVGPNRVEMIGGPIPVTSPPFGPGPVHYEGMPLMRRPIEENEYLWKNSSKTSKLKTEDLPASGEGEPGDPSASGKEEEPEELDLSLHL